MATSTTARPVRVRWNRRSGIVAPGAILLLIFAACLAPRAALAQAIEQAEQSGSAAASSQTGSAAESTQTGSTGASTQAGSTGASSQAGSIGVGQ